MGIGKWIMTGLGWAVGGPIGALVFYFISSAVSSSLKKDNDVPKIDGTTRRHRPYQNTGSSSDVHVALIVLIAAVMKADGEVKHSELNYVKRFLASNYGEERAKELLLALRDIVKCDIPLHDVCRQIKENTDYTTRYHMVDFLCGLAVADGYLDAAEQHVMRTIVTGLGVNASDYASIYARHSNFNSYSGRRSSGEGGRNTTGSHMASDPYSILGLTSSATDDEVRKAYRRLAMKYHPDRVDNMGEEIKRNAEAQFKKINEAYETIRRTRGMK